MGAGQRRHRLATCLGKRLVELVVLAHAGVSLGHGLTHAGAGVPLAPWQGAVVGLVVLLPVIGLGLLGRSHHGRGWLAICFGGLGSALFGTHFHFAAATPDHVRTVVGPWSLPFSLTALAISVLALATALVGGWGLLRGPRRRDDTAHSPLGETR